MRVIKQQDKKLTQVSFLLWRQQRSIILAVYLEVLSPPFSCQLFLLETSTTKFLKKSCFWKISRVITLNSRRNFGTLKSGIQRCCISCCLFISTFCLKIIQTKRLNQLEKVNEFTQNLPLCSASFALSWNADGRSQAAVQGKSRT